jgi:hypothetical protein
MDRNTLRGREILSGIGTHIAWAMLATKKGARRIRDSDSYRACLSRRKVLREELERLQRNCTQLLQDAPRRQDLTVRALMEVRALDEQRDEVRSQLRGLEHEIERLRHDPAARVAAADDRDDSELADRFDAIEREVDGQSAPEGVHQPSAALRTPPWLTIPEAAEVVDYSYPQVARWVNGKSLPFPLGDPRNPWQADRVPVDNTLGPRRRRLAVSGINPRYLASPAQRRRLAQILAHRPPGWSEAHCNAPLQILKANV